MRSLLGRFHRPNVRSQTEQLFMLNSLGDGSTLSLDFTTGVLDPRITFTRSTNATFINSQGYVTWSKSNLFLQGVDLSNASWTAANLASRSSGISNPFGVAQATELFENTINGAHGVRQTTTANVANQYYTFSVYMKAGVNRNIGCIYDTAVGGIDVVFYTLTGAGTVTIPAGSNSTMSGTITKITNNDPGDNWYRCTYTIYTTLGGGIHLGSANGTAFGNHSYAGTAGNSIVVWGGQFEMGQFANPFIPTTTAAKYDDPRFDHDPVTLTPRGLLIEGSANNLMTYSEDQGNNTTWSASGTSVTRTTGQTDPANNSTATKLVFDATTADAVISRSVTVLNATQYTISMWMRADSGTVTNVRFARAASSAGAIFPTLTTAWQRVQLTFTSSTTSDGIEIRVLNSGSPQTATVHLWGAQLEAGSGASSYIPTGASQGTRNQDALTSASSAAASRTVEFNLDDLTSGTSSLSALTVLLEYQRSGMSNDFPAVLYTRNDANSTRLDFRDYSSTTVETKTASRSVQTRAGIGATAIVKMAIAADGVNQPSSAINGTATTPGSGTIDSMVGNKWTQLGGIVGAVTGKYNSISLRRLKIWPTVLPNTTLQALTT